jgi:hypothetical protein
VEAVHSWSTGKIKVHVPRFAGFNAAVEIAETGESVLGKLWPQVKRAYQSLIRA